MAGETSFAVNPKRFYRQSSTGTARDKTNYLSILEELETGLRVAGWNQASCAIGTVGMPKHDFSGGPYLGETYDAFKMCGGYDSTTQKYIATAGCVAYRFKVPTSYREHYNATTCTADSFTVPLYRDRFLRSGVRIHVVASNSETPSTDWNEIHGEAVASGEVSLDYATAELNQTSVTYLVNAVPAQEEYTVDLTEGTLAADVHNYAYVWVYLTLDDYRDCWTNYNSSEKRLYAIEGAANLGASAWTFTDTDGILTPDADDEGTEVVPEDEHSPKSVTKRIIGWTAGFVGAAAITVGALWYGGKDDDGSLMPDLWESSFEVLTAITDPSQRGAYAADGDVMAYEDIVGGLLVCSNTETGVVAPYYVSTHDALFVGVGGHCSNLVARNVFPYGDTLGVGTNLTLSPVQVVTGMAKTRSYRLVHFQVREQHLFESGVATEGGARTKPFTALDKYLLARFLMENGMGPGESNAYKRATSPEAYTTLVPGVTDYDQDGVSDGWELYVGANPWSAGDAASDWDGDTVSLFGEYRGGESPTDPYHKYTNGSVIPDRCVISYDLSPTDSCRDSDGDGLSNYAEYIISEVFQFTRIDAHEAMTSDSTKDYFKKTCDVYFGEVFTDHDSVDDAWESKYSDLSPSDGKPYASTAVYDPSRDADGDGWSNYAENMVGTDPRMAYSVGIDGNAYSEHPVPTIKMNVSYNGKLNAVGAPLVVKCWNENADDDMVMAPDAIWTVKTGGTGTSEQTTRTKYIGRNDGLKRTFVLGSGTVSPGTVSVRFCDLGWKTTTVSNGVEIATTPGSSAKKTWYTVVQDVNGILTTCITNEAETVEVGSVDYASGKVTIDLGASALAREIVVSESEVAGKTNVYACEKIDLASSYVKVEWQATSLGNMADGTYYLGDADAPGTTEATKTLGFVREGDTKFVAFYDLDSNGEYTAGEPFGFVQGVDVGWQGAAFDINLTDVNTIFARINLTDGTNDRGVINDSNYNLMSNTVNRIESPYVMMAPEGYVRVRVVRTAVNGTKIVDMVNPSDSSQHVPETVVMDKKMNMNIRPYIHEGDFITATYPDIDWALLASDADKYNSSGWGWPDNMTNVTYRIVFGDAKISSNYTNTPTFKYMVDRRFDTDVAAGWMGYIPTPELAEDVGTYSTRPTFSWSVSDGKNNYNSYSAFKLEVLSADASTVLYDSGLQPTPMYETSGGINYYVWTAPSIVDNMSVAGGKIARNGTYKWRVTIYNAKYKTGKQSATRTLTTSVNVTYDVGDHTYSTIPVTVKYTGPVSVLEKAKDLSTLLGKVRVQAFTSADFSGAPVSETLVTNELSDTAITTANAKLCGLPMNAAYYLRAYIDSNGKLEKDDWESWGAATNIIAAGTTTPAGIYIEDADTDDDWLPDAYEFAQNNWKGTDGWLEKRGKTVSGEFNVNEKLYTSVTTSTLTAGLSAGLTGAPLTAFTYDESATLALGSTNYQIASFSVANRVVEKNANDGTVTVTHVDISTDGATVTIGLEPHAEGISGRSILETFAYTETAAVVLKIYHRTTLAEEWTIVQTKTVEISDTMASMVSVTLSPTLDMTSGFYKAEVDAAE